MQVEMTPEMEGTSLNGDNELTVKKPTLWSAGAADYDIVACVTKENKIQMAHCTRTGIQPEFHLDTDLS
ncbi:hypothetical protein [Marinomonas sp. MED121]|uniref:hypothetical protein n=1 Tax=Marinomonas sp. MED121 TaxID=314277 RepID=UPI0010401CA1|nr:hypothetical protein [Marinomonas sp. MED121]